MDDYSVTTTTSLGSVATDSYNYINAFFSSKIVILIVLVLVLMYVMLFLSLGNSSTSAMNSSATSTSTSSGTIFMALILIIFVILLFLNGFKYLFGIDIVTKIKNIGSGTPEIDIKATTKKMKEKIPKSASSSTILMPEVFNVSDNVHTYEEAKAICKAYDARLATNKELEEAYESGGEWCNYGWSEGQMALYPTQQETWDKLQKIKGHENDCGRPGVNGGYVANPDMKFGVNCYGFKPGIKPKEQELMTTVPIYPKTEQDIAMENRVKYWKDNLGTLIVSPFNHNSWSRL
jgi:hypothetical protein